MSIPELYELFIHNPIVTTDSRHCPRGSIFFALKGDRFDGNQYAAKALAGGSNYAVIDNPDYYQNERTILVDDVLKALQLLAQRHRKAVGVPVLAITGTNGKTTTKELIAAVLSTKFNLLYTEGNLNNQIGVPLTLLRLNHEHEMAVIEMGASHPGDIKELVEIAQPEYGLITNVGRAHLEGFESFENVLKTKGELYDYIRRTKGIVFVKKEDKPLRAIAQGIEQITYGYGDSSFASGQIIGSDPYLVFQWKQQGKNNVVETQLIGDYNIDNALAAVTIGRYFKIPSARINRAIEGYAPSNKRSQLKKTAHNTLLVDTYNANPTSMKAALDNFAGMSATPKAVILGDMFELGAESDNLHAEIVEQLAWGGFDKIYLCGEHFSRTGGEKYNHYQTTEALMAALREQPLQGYTILIKGSRGMALERVEEVL
ncbi:UDP-N-acetylmuramoyl-tripeptide--D-alanyl-D-alanine ligase [Parabacteroides sp. PFB2-12]|uniref:UDP-N-acetylmuramoyl-tripeptide--D-alanyl-D- alanine ligase n=1 Tax=unclassified Parabacteroides TaxID=2649774 RepID=UPI002473BCBD|nr:MULTISPECIES: UDP-N-acetylmuramoyl-tripeptide--D-alanyl-D-alanine ligase [unclassified Parabacteroides]MDH6344065.1 UDP-N-acetylmuramoyl-tripeptide--D-alanyl-D-alanine ligase [Parabacteroides sp. PM6-13]MDH6391822.1 UDP-N-acetylmuramoyl-tripeptide--D-alanyl-D-alanine ligase [Parabacteroides sp. PFB2-12]